jgi:nitrate reductase (cytochrome), electron transfer subunit
MSDKIDGAVNGAAGNAAGGATSNAAGGAASGVASSAAGGAASGVAVSAASSFSSKKKLIAAVVVVIAVCIIAVVAFNAMRSSNVVAGESPDAPPVMKAGHEGRYETLGAAGCYGCHGVNSENEPMLKAATSMPDDHYAGGIKDSSAGIALDHATCNSCHVQG